MFQVKIGKFIAECRKKMNLTQMQLAEKLGITDRAISKLENGKGLPDTSIMLDLCKELEISVNELLSREVIDMSNYDKKTEELLLEMAKNEERHNKNLITAMWVILTVDLLFYFAVLGFTTVFIEEGPIYLAIVLVATLVFLIVGFIGLKFEVDAGYYECKNCKHRFVPTYKQVMMAPHYGTTRKLKCPKCGEKRYDKKVMTKE